MTEGFYWVIEDKGDSWSVAERDTNGKFLTGMGFFDPARVQQRGITPRINSARVESRHAHSNRAAYSCSLVARREHQRPDVQGQEGQPRTPTRRSGFGMRTPTCGSQIKEDASASDYSRGETANPWTVHRCIMHHPEHVLILPV